MATSNAAQATSELPTQHAPTRENLIPLLQDLQERDGYLSKDAIGTLAAASGISDNEIYG